MNSNNTSSSPPETVGKTKEEEDAGIESLTMPCLDAASAQTTNQPTNQMDSGDRTNHFQTSAGIVLIKTHISCLGGDSIQLQDVYGLPTQHPWAYKKICKEARHTR